MKELKKLDWQASSQSKTATGFIPLADDLQAPPPPQFIDLKFFFLLLKILITGGLQIYEVHFRYISNLKSCQNPH